MSKSFFHSFRHKLTCTFCSAQSLSTISTKYSVDSYIIVHHSKNEYVPRRLPVARPREHQHFQDFKASYLTVVVIAAWRTNLSASPDRSKRVRRLRGRRAGSSCLQRSSSGWSGGWFLEGHSQMIYSFLYCMSSRVMNVSQCLCQKNQWVIGLHCQATLYNLQK